MTTRRLLAALILVPGLFVNAALGAAEPREITWDDLVPAEAEFDDPFTKLDEDTLYELTLVAQVRDQAPEQIRVELPGQRPGELGDDE